MKKMKFSLTLALFFHLLFADNLIDCLCISLKKME